jgi:CheY-like chemotaxis protein
VEGAQGKQHVVLVVDDDEPTRALIARILTQELKVQVTLAGTCEEALRLADRRKFDAILLDLLMPGIGGIEVLRQLRSRSLNTQTPVVIVSVLDDKETIDRCMALKAHAFVTKPVRREVIAKIVKAQLPSGPEIPDSWDAV